MTPGTSQRSTPVSTLNASTRPAQNTHPPGEDDAERQLRRRQGLDECVAVTRTPVAATIPTTISRA